MSKDAFWFPHDCNARSDLRMTQLRRIHGLEGIGAYWCIIEMLREANDDGYEIDMSRIDDICFALNIKPKIFDTFFERNGDGEFVGLLRNDGQVFWSDSLKRRMRPFDEKRKKLSEAGRRGGQISKRPPDSKAKKLKTKSPPSPSPELAAAENLCNLMRDEMKSEKTDSVISITKKWVDDMEKLIRIDGRTPAQIQRVIQWACHDTGNGDSSWPGWAANVRSPGKLRQKFDKLEIAMRRGVKPAARQNLTNQEQAYQRAMDVLKGE